MEPPADDSGWTALKRLQCQTTELGQLEVADIKTRLDKQLTSLTDHVDEQIRSGPFLLESRQGTFEDKNMYKKVKEGDDDNNHEDGHEDGEEEDDDPNNYEVDYDLSIFRGDGEIGIDGELIRVSDWLGAEYTNRIVRHAAPL